MSKYRDLDRLVDMIQRELDKHGDARNEKGAMTAAFEHEAGWCLGLAYALGAITGTIRLMELNKHER